MCKGRAHDADANGGREQPRKNRAVLALVGDGPIALVLHLDEVDDLIPVCDVLVAISKRAKERWFGEQALKAQSWPGHGESPKTTARRDSVTSVSMAAVMWTRWR